MITLIKLELGKLIRRVSFILCVLMLMINCVSSYGNQVDPFGMKLYIVEEDGTILHGRAAIRWEKETLEPYRGVLTDELVEEIKQGLDWNERQKEIMFTNGKVKLPYAYEVVLTLYTTTLETAEYLGDDGRHHTASISASTETPQKIADVFPDSTLPLRLEYSLPWLNMWESMLGTMFLLPVLILFILSPIFSEERTHQMNALLFTSRFGKRKCFRAKITAAYVMGAVFAMAFILFYVLVTLAFFGGDGLNGSIQISSPIWSYQDLPYATTVGSAIRDTVLLCTADVFFTVSLTVFGSVLAKHVLNGMIISAALWAWPIVLSFVNVVPKQIRLLAPIVNMTDFTGVLRLPDMAFGSVNIPYSYMAAGILIFLSALLTLCAAGVYRHAVGE